jgi:hypothetical protein
MTICRILNGIINIIQRKAEGRRVQNGGHEPWPVVLIAYPQAEIFEDGFDDLLILDDTDNPHAEQARKLLRR